MLFTFGDIVVIVFWSLCITGSQCMQRRSLAGSMSGHYSRTSSVMTIFETETARNVLHQTNDNYCSVTLYQVIQCTGSVLIFCHLYSIILSNESINRQSGLCTSNSDCRRRHMSLS